MYVCMFIDCKIYIYLQNHACLDMFGYYKDKIMKYERYVYIYKNPE